HGPEREPAAVDLGVPELESPVLTPDVLDGDPKILVSERHGAAPVGTGRSPRSPARPVIPNRPGGSGHPPRRSARAAVPRRAEPRRAHGGGRRPRRAPDRSSRSSMSIADQCRRQLALLATDHAAEEPTKVIAAARRDLDQPGIPEPGDGIVPGRIS